MQYRKQILVAALACLALFYGGDWLLQTVFLGPLDRARAKTGLIDARIEKYEAALGRARQAAKVLAEWESQSLPADVEVALSLYQGWLLELVEHVGLSRYSVDSSTPVNKRVGYRVLPFSVRGRGTLQQLVTFLFEFYHVGYVHQIRSLSMAPVPNSDQFELVMSVEALSLSRALRENKLPSSVSDRLVHDDLAGYDVIVQRNLFHFGGSADATEHTWLTGVTYDNNQPVAWFSLQATGEVLTLRAGDSFAAGQFEGAVAEIEESDVIVESDGQRWLLSIGDSLADAFALPPEH